jgi:two-component system nitrogen regulation response regulator GlnG
MSHLLIVDDEEAICWGLKRLAMRSGHTVDVAPSAETGLSAAVHRRPQLIILDVRLPGIDGLSAMERFRTVAPGAPIVVITAFGNLETAVTAVRNGAFDYLTKPFDLEQITAVMDRALEHSRRDVQTTTASSIDDVPDEIVGKSAAMQEVFKRIALVAASDASVLITGESGTGKELVARAVHRHSIRNDQPFIPIHLAALSPTLVESELFGHVKGAFTGAETTRAGMLELANGATVFFDETGDIPLGTQVKLLRVLEQHELTPVGDTQVRKTNFRTICATGRDLRKDFSTGSFRQDLYFRLATFEIMLPPLRERADDIPLLAERFLLRATRAGQPTPRISDAALKELSTRAWPGNVRELRNAVEHAALVARGAVISADHLPPPLELDGSSTDPTGQLRDAVRRWASQQLSDGETPSHLYDDFLAQVEPPLFDTVLATTSNNRAAAAEMLGIHRATLRKKLS